MEEVLVAVLRGPFNLNLLISRMSEKREPPDAGLEPRLLVPGSSM